MAETLAYDVLLYLQILVNEIGSVLEIRHNAANVRRFQQKLESLGVNATVRRRLGSEISAACGQLRRDEMNGKA